MTIQERKDREQYDRENPWRPMNTAKPDGTICELLFQDMKGEWQSDKFRYFMDYDGKWYRIDPPEEVHKRPMNWRPVYAKITPEKKRYVQRLVYLDSIAGAAKRYRRGTAP